MRSSILFLVFNRPDVTSQVFDAIRKARPTRLYIAADGPRKDRSGEYDRCQTVLEIVSKVDWPCKVSRLIRNENLGCKVAVSSAIDWFFSHEAEGIILEDDCLPSSSFFQFCDDLLEKYRDDNRIGMISGDNFQGDIKRGSGDYYFSRYCHIWGWATWARAWKKYDVNVSQWPQLKAGGWMATLGLNRSENIYWSRAFDRVYTKVQNTWDYQWVFACWLNRMIAVMPNQNLISNIGFNDEATHTTSNSIYANMKVNNLEFPLSHPREIRVDRDADLLTCKSMFEGSKLKRAFRKLQNILGVKS